MNRFLKRISDALGVGKKYYNGYLINYFDELFKKIEKNHISPDNAKLKVKDIFLSNKNLKDEFLKINDGAKNKLKIIGSKIRLFYRIRFGIIYVDINEYEPIHYHNNFISFQVILEGKCRLHEYDKIKINKNKISYKSFPEQFLDINDVMLNFSKYRNIHGFGSVDKPLTILSIGKYYGLFGKFHLNTLLNFNSGRNYLDINNQNSIGKDIYEASFIENDEAYMKYSKILK